MDATMTASQDRAVERFVPAPHTERRLRDAFARFATGVTVVTAHGPHGPVGMTANSFSSVSLDPPLVLWCLGKASDRYDVFANAARYAVHILDEGQQAQSNGFARDPQFFAQTGWHEGADSVPALDGCIARFDCSLHAVHDAGDHVILVGRVLAVELGAGMPLLFAMGGYGGLVRS